MSKALIRPSDYLYPQPVVLIGANVNDMPNFTTVSWAGIANETPPMISVALKYGRYTLKGIKQNNVFSVNIPSTEMVKETDYCGIASGAQVNKAEVCQFKITYGKLAKAPLVKQCPVSLECQVIQTLDLGSHSLIIGEITQAHISENCLTNGKLDINKVSAIVYITGTTGQYHAIGDFLANAYSVGKEINA
jgi:flavin reductase (DIM6/NTAB) family NADH-FMN oxidoreductase RutF